MAKTHAERDYRKHSAAIRNERVIITIEKKRATKLRAAVEQAQMHVKESKTNWKIA
jgi:hypothetical protein